MPHDAKNVRHGAENVRCCAKKSASWCKKKCVMVPQSPNQRIPETPIHWNTIKALERDKIADGHTDRHINTMN